MLGEYIIFLLNFLCCLTNSPVVNHLVLHRHNTETFHVPLDYIFVEVFGSHTLLGVVSPELENVVLLVGLHVLCGMFIFLFFQVELSPKIQILGFLHLLNLN